MVPWTHIVTHESHLNEFSRFCTAQPCAQHTDRQTDHALGNICALHAGDATKSEVKV